MAKALIRNGNGLRSAQASKYDAQNTVLSKTYGALADLRRELADSKAAVSETGGVAAELRHVRGFAAGVAIAGGLFREALALAQGFSGHGLVAAVADGAGQGPAGGGGFPLHARPAVGADRAEQPTPTSTGSPRCKQAAREQQHVRQLEAWLFPPKPAHFDGPRAFLRAVCQPQPDEEYPGRHRLAVQLHLQRPRTGEKVKTLGEIIELTTRAGHEQELFPPGDWEFIEWLAETHEGRNDGEEAMVLSDLELLHWLARWGQTTRLELVLGDGPPQGLEFHGEVAELTPHLENGTQELAFTHRLTVPGGKVYPLSEVRFFNRHPPLVLVGRAFYLLRNAPPPQVVEHWASQPVVPMRKLSHRLLMHLRKTQSSHGVDWEQLCVAHQAKPQFVFELLDETVRLRLLAKSQRDQSLWQWSGHEWQLHEAKRPRRAGNKPEILDDPRLEPATQWLRRLDWFTSEPGLWVGDATEGFLSALAGVWAERPQEADYLGNPGFSRLFMAPRQLRPRVVVKGSGIDWLAVSAEWEHEGMKLTAADLQRLQTATGRFVKLPDSGWVELDSNAVQSAHEAMADLGVDGLVPVAQRIGLEQVAHLDEEELKRFGDSAQAKALRERIKNFEGLPAIQLPAAVQAEMRPYQKDGFDFLCHLTSIRLGGDSRGRHGSGQDVADTGVAGVAERPAWERPEAIAGDLSRLGAAQLAARGQPLHAQPEGARAGERRRAAQLA